MEITVKTRPNSPTRRARGQAWLKGSLSGAEYLLLRRNSPLINEPAQPMRSAIPIKPYPTATTILLNLVSVATPLQLTSIASRPAVDGLAGDLVGIVPGIAGGAQHGGALLQLHLP
jgi:hypothetical protein